jgi:hypothetical protein
MNILWKGLTVLAAVLMVGLNSCSTSPKPFEYESHRELKPGPGLFSGEDGSFTIYQQQGLSEGKSDKGSETNED